jgi:hypothetical protein
MKRSLSFVVDDSAALCLTSVKAWVSRLIVGYGGEEFLMDVVKWELMMGVDFASLKVKKSLFRDLSGFQAPSAAFQLELMEGRCECSIYGGST